MPTKHYNWKRFWRAKGEHTSFDLDGFPSDPEDFFYGSGKPSVPFEQLTRKQCLILLGEPGIGKSTSLRDAKRWEEEHRTCPEDFYVSVNLSECDFSQGLHAEVFDLPDVRSWISRDGRLFLYLDSYDEASPMCPNLANLLAREIRTLPAERLYLRIACRTADWPTFLDDELKQIWDPKETFGEYELQPLCRKDVRAAAESEQADADAFTQTVRDAGVVPFAIKPLTLRFLIDRYKEAGTLPSSRAELFRLGCLHLCSENSEGRRAAGLKGVLTPEQRFAVAARIAAAMVFSNKMSIFTGASPAVNKKGALGIAEICGCTEEAYGYVFQVGEEQVLEALSSTGLFVSSGLDTMRTMRWSHQSYAEFLAAQYLSAHKMGPKQKMSLLIHPQSEEQRLVPQLHVVAAWMANEDREILHQIGNCDPEALLQMDMTELNEEGRRYVVDCTLAHFARIKTPRFSGVPESTLARLCHPGLEEQLKLHLVNKTSSVAARQWAMEIAVSCGLNSLYPIICEVALDDSEPYQLKIHAAWLLSRTEDNARLGLKPLLRIGVRKDPSKELKGAALWALWPQNVGKGNVFRFIKPAKNDCFTGLYEGFIEHELLARLRPEDVVAALGWAAEQSRSTNATHHTKGAIAGIMESALKFWDVPGVPDAFAEAALVRIRARKPIFEDHHWGQPQSPLEQHPELIPSLVKAIVERMDDPDSQTFLCHHYHSELKSVGISWAIEQLREAKESGIRRSWAAWIHWMFRQTDAKEADAIIVASGEIVELREAFSNWIGYTDLDSDDARKRREQWERDKQTIQGRQQRSSARPDPGQRAPILATLIQDGHLDIWSALARMLNLSPEGISWEREWSESGGHVDPEVLAKIVDSAKIYVLKHETHPDEWLGRPFYYQPDHDGYLALRLLWHRDPEFVSGLNKDVWRNWAPVVVTFFPPSGVTETPADPALMRMAFEQAPEASLSAALAELQREDQEKHGLHLLRRLEWAWNEQLSRALHNLVLRGLKSPYSLEFALRVLLGHGYEESRQYCYAMLRNLAEAPAGSYEMLSQVASSLVLHDRHKDWDLIWGAVSAVPDIAKRFVGILAFSLRLEDRLGSFFGGLSEAQTASFYVWLESEFPPPQPKKGVGWISHQDAPDKIDDMRRGALNNLRQRGTPEACAALAKIQERLPDLVLDWHMDLAEDAMLEATWNPPSAETILKLARDADTRYVESADQLLDAIMESLARFQAALRGDNATLHRVWNVVDKKHTPKPENILRDEIAAAIKMDLEDKGVIVNREVGIHKRESMDIDVTAVSKRGNSVQELTVTVEVKLDSNPKALSDMEEQLCNRYLTNSNCHHGIYVVGWHRDKTRGKGPRNYEEAREFFEEQARSLSNQERTIRAFVVDARWDRRFGA